MESQVLIFASICILAIAILLRPKASVTDGQFLSMSQRITALEGEIKGLHKENSELKAYMLMLISDPTNATLHAIVRQKMMGNEGNSVVELVASGNIAKAIDMAWEQAPPDKINNFAILKGRWVGIVNDQTLSTDERTRGLNSIAHDLLAMV